MRQPVTIATLTAAVVLCVACATNDAPARTTDDPSVYVAALDLLFARDTGVRHLVLADDMLPVDSGAMASAVARIPIVDDGDSTARNFAARGLRAEHAPAAADIQARIGAAMVVASRTTLERLRAQADSDATREPGRFASDVDAFWARVHREYAPGTTLVSLSPAAYSQDLRHAMVYVRYACGGACGGSYWVALDRTGTSWRVRHVQAGAGS